MGECICPQAKCRVCIEAIQVRLLQFMVNSCSSDITWVPPRYPWESARAKTTRVSEQPCTTDSGHGKVTSLCSDTPSLKLNKFLLEMEKDQKDSISIHLNAIILNDVNTMITQTVENLKEKYPETFRGAVIHRVGSVAEGTKLGLFDEFDFMIELPSVLSYLEEDTTWLGEAVDYWPDTVDIGIPFPPKVLQQQLQEEVTAVLLPRWELSFDLTENIKGLCVATLLNLRHFPDSGGPHIDVFCDMAFCFPFMVTSKMEVMLKNRNDIDDVNLLPLKKYQFIINRHLINPTQVFQENQKLIQSEPLGNVRRVYRLAKILTRDFLPPVYDIERVKFEGPIPSYWLKQIILYMMAENPDPAFWAECNFGKRVPQVMDALRKCLESNMLTVYFAPKKNLLFGELDGNFVARSFVPGFADMIEEASKGDNSALTSLAILPTVLEQFKARVATQAKRMSLAYILYIDENLDRMSTLRDFVSKNLQDVELKGGGRALRIVLRDESTGDRLDMSVEDYVEKHMKTKALFSGMNAKMFPTEWMEVYQKLFMELTADPSQS